MPGSGATSCSSTASTRKSEAKNTHAKTECLLGPGRVKIPTPFARPHSATARANEACLFLVPTRYRGLLTLMTPICAISANCASGADSTGICKQGAWNYASLPAIRLSTNKCFLTAQTGRMRARGINHLRARRKQGFLKAARRASRVKVTVSNWRRYFQAESRFLLTGSRSYDT
jgi:hypothetical protein